MQQTATIALESYRAALEEAVARGTLYEFATTALDHLDQPLWTVALVAEDGALCDGFGYGPTWQAAQASAWGEAVEWFFARDALKRMPRVEASYADLMRRGRAALDPVALNLSAGSAYTPDMPLTWVEAHHYPSGETVLVPIEAAAPRYADIGPNVNRAHTVTTPITNGLGAGPSFAHALAHGIMEVLQRDGNSVNYRAMDRGIVVELDTVEDTETQALLAHLDAQGVEVVVKLADTSFGITNLYVVGYDRDPTRSYHPLALSACGEAAHPDRERALAKALREFISARVRKPFCHGSLANVAQIAPRGYLDLFKPSALRSEDDRALQEMRRWLALDHQQFFDLIREPIFTERERVRFSTLPTVPWSHADDAQTRLDLLQSRLAADGLDIFYVDFTPDGSSVTVLKAIAPGLEVETMTYQRIGGRNLRRLLERGSPLIGRGARPVGALPILLRSADEAALGPAWLDPAALDAAMGDLYAMYREPGRHVIGFAK